jgi:acetyltransferase-like isoleucine patch superfamily enzyme
LAPSAEVAFGHVFPEADLQARMLRASWLVCKARLKGRSLTIGRSCRIASSGRLEPGTGSIIIGDFVDIQPGAILASQGGMIRLGNNVSVNAYSVLYGEGGLVIGNDVRIAAPVVIIPANHRFSDRNLPIRKQGRTKRCITIKDVSGLVPESKCLTAHISVGDA